MPCPHSRNSSQPRDSHGPVKEEHDSSDQEETAWKHRVVSPWDPGRKPAAARPPIDRAQRGARVLLTAGAEGDSYLCATCQSGLNANGEGSPPCDACTILWVSVSHMVGIAALVVVVGGSGLLLMLLLLLLLGL